VLAFQSREDDSDPEDEWFGKRLSSMPDFKVASALDSQHFSVEEVYHEKPMGYHLRDGGGRLPPGVWKSSDQRAKILKYCPDVAIILPMKLERERCDGDNREGAIDEAEAERIKIEEAEAERVRQQEKQRIEAEEAEEKQDEANKEGQAKPPPA
jgi:hypothetical protein